MEKSTNAAAKQLSDFQDSPTLDGVAVDTISNQDIRVPDVHGREEQSDNKDSRAFGGSNILWSQCIEALQGNLEPHIFQAYFANLALGPVCETTNTATVFAPSALVGKQLARQHKQTIEEVISSALGRRTSIQIKVPSASLQQDATRNGPASAPLTVVQKSRTAETVRQETNRSGSAAPLSRTTNPKYTFDNFVVGNNNQFCHAAAMRVGEDPGNSYNPLFIYGGVGLGKTHLLHAIGNRILADNPRAKVLYLSSETFINDLVQALRFQTMDAFKSKMRSLDVLLIDDIQFIAGKERTEEEFFHTFNALYSAKNQIVLTSDKLPHEIPGIEERLHTRFSWGLTADIQAPDFETRVAILKRKALVDQFELPLDAAHYIAENVSSNVRELEGALTKLHAVSSLQGMPISLDVAKSALERLIKPKTVNITIDEIKQMVAAHFKLKVSDLVSKRRTRNLSLPRHIAMYICRNHTTSSYPEIGAQFGGRDHSSVVHAAKVIEKKVKEDEEMRKVVKELEERLFGK